jgi:hypothetical protein
MKFVQFLHRFIWFQFFLCDLEFPRPGCPCPQAETAWGGATAAGPYYVLGIIGTVPRAYDILRSTMEWKGEKIEIKE